MFKKSLLLAAASAALLVPLAHADAWPQRPITLVIPGAPGTAADVIGRKVGEHLRTEFGQPVVIDNRVGAGGTIAYDHVARQKPDGYTLSIVVGGFAIAPVIYKNLRFDPVKDFTPITQLAITPMFFITRPESPLKSIVDLAQQAKASPKKITYGSFGNGSTSHLVGESFGQLAGQLVHVPYKSGTATIPDVVSGQLDVAIIDPVAALPLVKAGRVKALGIAGPSRAPGAPDAPTVAEAGLPFSAVGWVGLFAPAGVPVDIAEKLNRAANAAMATPDMRAMLNTSGSMPVEPALDLAQWKGRFGDYVKNWGAVARDTGMIVE